MVRIKIFGTSKLQVVGDLIMFMSEGTISYLQIAIAVLMKSPLLIMTLFQNLVMKIF